MMRVSARSMRTDVPPRLLAGPGVGRLIPMNPSQATTAATRATDYDLIVVGGAFSGSAFAVLMKRWLPELNVLIVERSTVFERKVGEATVEVSAIFLHRILGLYDHLSREHLPKHGLRYWFANSADCSLHEMTEIGPKEVPSLPSFQLDRPTLDEYLLGLAESEGIDVMRPAKVQDVELQWPCNRVTVSTGSESRQMTCRWLIDASGRQAFLARRLGLQRRFDDHPTAAIWARWTGVKDLDGVDFVGPDPRNTRLPPIAAARRLATNHFCGYGWWSWVIPLAGGQTSIGIVYHKELFELPAAKGMRAQYERFARSTPGLRELVHGADIDGDDFMALRHLPYGTERYMDLGWALIGDSASFIDPYYSPGLDHASISIFATARVIERDLKGGQSNPVDHGALVQDIERHNSDFDASFGQWFGALYDGKYEILGDADLTRCAFLMDTGLYYAAVVSGVERDLDTLANAVFGHIPQAKAAYRSTRWFNQRLLKLARFRRRAGTYGRSNVGRRFLSKAFRTGLPAAVRPIGTALGIWLRIEMERLLYHLRYGKVDVSSPVELAPPAPESAPAAP